MLRSRPGNFRLQDFMPDGRPDLSWYHQFYQYQRVIWEGRPGLEALMLPNGVRNAAAQVVLPVDALVGHVRNYLRDASMWYLEEDTSSPPSLAGATTYVTERKQDLVDILLEMLRIIHVVGHGIIYVQNEMIYLTWGTNIVPIVDAGNPIPRGWIQFWPYYLRPENDKSGVILDTPNRIRTLIYLDGETSGGDVPFYQGYVGRPDQDSDRDRIPPEHLNPPPISYLAVFGSDEGFYEEGLKAASELAALNAVIMEISTTYSIPVPIVNAKVGVTDARGGLVDIQGNPIIAGRLRALQSVDPDGPPLEFAQAATMISDLMEQYVEKNKELHGITRIPLDITQNRDDQMSGVSRALLARPAVSRIEGGHRQAAEALDGAVRVRTGAGLGEVTWTKNPMDTLAERRLVASEMFQAGIWSLNEAREYMDLEPVDGGDTIAATQQQDPQQQEDPDA